MKRIASLLLAACAASRCLQISAQLGSLDKPSANSLSTDGISIF